MNLPNKISLVRIFLIPVIVVAFYIPWAYSGYLAAALFAVAALTDFVDGKLARKYNLVTNIGKFLDSIADKMLVNVGLLLVLSSNALPSPWGLITVAIIICRDLIVGCLRQIAAANGKVIAADQIGKIKATFQDIAIPLLFVVPHWMIWAGVTTDNIFANGFSVSLIFILIAYLTYAIAVVLTIISGFTYLTKNRAVFKTEEAESDK